MSHSSQDDAAQIISRVRTISESIAILLDTRGPEVRTTEVEAPIDFQVGDKLEISGVPGTTTKEVVHVNYPAFSRAMEPLDVNVFLSLE